MKERCIRAVLALLVLSSLMSSAQTEEGTVVVRQDLESWNSIGLKYKASKKSDFQFDQGIRMNKDMSVIDQALSDLSYKLKVSKLLSFGVGLRYSANRGANEEFDNDFRYNFDLNLKHKLDRFYFKYRFRYQNKNELGKSSEEGDLNKVYVRLKAGIGYNIRNWKLDPLFSSELFRSYTSGSKGLDNIRFTLGTKYSLKKSGDLGFFYRLEKELNNDRPKTTYILGLKYVYTLK